MVGVALAAHGVVRAVQDVLTSVVLGSSKYYSYSK